MVGLALVAVSMLLMIIVTIMVRITMEQVILQQIFCGVAVLPVPGSIKTRF